MGKKRNRLSKKQKYGSKLMIWLTRVFRMQEPSQRAPTIFLPGKAQQSDISRSIVHLDTLAGRNCLCFFFRYKVARAIVN